MKLTLLCFGIKSSITEIFQNLFDMFLVRCYIIRTDENIIKIDYDTNI